MTITDALSCTTFAPLNTALSAKIDRKLTEHHLWAARSKLAWAVDGGRNHTPRNTYKSYKAAERAAKKMTSRIEGDWGAGCTEMTILTVRATAPAKGEADAFTRPAFVPIITVCVASCWAGYLSDSSRLAPAVAYHSLFGGFLSAAGYGARGNVVVIPFGRE